jgi:hypothetical protein
LLPVSKPFNSADLLPKNIPSNPEIPAIATMIMGS